MRHTYPRLALSLVAALGFTIAGATANAAPKRGGILKYIIPSNPPSADGHRETTFGTIHPFAQFYSVLIRVNPDNPGSPTDFKCDLCVGEVPNPTNGGLKYTFKIRQGVEFHDGSALTADDVVWSMNRHIAEGSPSSIGAFFTLVEEWKAVDKHTVKLTLSSPDADMPFKLTQPQAKIVKKDNPLVGSGPYLTEEFQAGVKSNHVRNPNYWRDTGQHLDSIEITAITDPNARLNALLAGSVDMVVTPSAKMIKKIEESGNTVLSVPSGVYGGICCLKNTAPGDNDDLVQGLRLIQDRERIVRTYLKGHGTLGNDHPINIAYGADHCHELPQIPYDPDQAKWHLNKSGYSEAELFVAPVSGAIEDTCLLMQANLKKIGFDLKLKKVPTDGYWGAVWMKEPLNVVSWNMRPTANAMMALQFGPNGNWNDTYWNSDRMGQLLKDSLAETDPVKRHELHCEMQKLVSTQSGIIIPYHTNVLDGHNSKIHGFSNCPLGAFGGNGWAEHIWREA